MRTYWLIAVVLGVSACSSPFRARSDLPNPESLPDVRLRVTDHFYPVHGRTVPHIGESLRNDGPLVGRDRVLALTTWRVGWGGRSTMTAGTCRLADLRVSVAVEMILPRWIDGADASQLVQDQWQSFHTAVSTHELGHRKLAAQAGAALLATLRGVRTPTCDDVTGAASASARDVLRRYRAADQEYDPRTLRGESQGARWPPPS